jgi:hypothetical protein
MKLYGGGESYGTPINVSYSFLLRLKNPYDLTDDVGKKVYFDNNVCIFW